MKVFANEIFPAINEKRFYVLYSDVTPKPNTPVNVIVGALIIKELFGYSDDGFRFQDSGVNFRQFFNYVKSGGNYAKNRCLHKTISPIVKQNTTKYEFFKGL